MQEIVIVGGGFAGVVTAVQLIRHGSSSVRLTIVERHGRPGNGVAYGTENHTHLLNVPAGNMSAFCDDPQHFLQWAQEHHDAKTESTSFLPRHVYGKYMEWVFQTTAESSPKAALHWIRDEVIAIEDSSAQRIVRLASGTYLTADRVVLCLGNLRPTDTAVPGRNPSNSSRYVSYAWSESAINDLDHAKSVLLLGSGLTSIDLVLKLRASGFRGIIQVLSRRGLLPQSHKTVRPWTLFWNETLPRTTPALLRLVRDQVKLAGNKGSDWRAVIDSLRGVTQRIWLSLPVAERRRFLRHVRPYWEAHRHRVAPEIAAIIAEEISNDRLRLCVGRVTNYCEDDNGVSLTYKKRECASMEVIRVDRVINCTRPDTDYRYLDDTLIRYLQMHGLGHSDPLFLGFDVALDGALINSRGQPSTWLYTVGPTRKGSLWETTAVPEIREQALILARQLTKKHEQPSCQVRRIFSTAILER